MNVNQYLVNTLKKVGADSVFGIPSYVGMKLNIALHEEGFKFVLNSHEQNAAHFAEGYWLATGKLPILLLAPGPGITNALTGIVNAYVDSVPMVVLAGRPFAGGLGKNEYHSNTGIGRTLDERTLLKSCTKASFVIDSKDNAIAYINDAIKTALTGRPGPVSLTIPPELQTEELKINKIPRVEYLFIQNKNIPADEDLKEFEGYFRNSKKPLFIIGKEYRDKDFGLLQTVLSDNAPYFTTYAAKGRVPILNNYLGTDWYCNSDHIRQACEEADLVIALGDDFVAFSNRVFRNVVENKIIQIHPYSEEIGRVFNPLRGYCSEATEFLKQIQSIKKPWNKLPKKHQIDSRTGDYLRTLTKLIQSEVTYFADVGNAGYLSISDLDLNVNQKFYTSGKSGVCGYSIPTAVGYSYGNPSGPVFSIAGDLSFLMNLQEVALVQKFKTKNSFFIFNNHCPQNIEQDQLEEHGFSVQCEVPEIKYEDFAKSFGLKFKKIDSSNEFEEFLRHADFMRENYIVNLEIPRGERPIVGG